MDFMGIAGLSSSTNLSRKLTFIVGFCIAYVSLEFSVLFCKRASYWTCISSSILSIKLLYLIRAVLVYELMHLNVSYCRNFFSEKNSAAFHQPGSILIFFYLISDWDKIGIIDTTLVDVYIYNTYFPIMTFEECFYVH